MGYRNPVITRRFDELVEEGDTSYVVMRNPQTMPGTEFTAIMAGGETAGDEEKLARIHGMLAGLVIGWRVWDPTVPVKANPETGELIHDEETTPRLLPLPATAGSVAILPTVILSDLMDQVTKVVNPPQSPAEPTGKTS
jgi:hypothetical protein